jgi:peptidyl-tRNA hydrolase
MKPKEIASIFTDYIEQGTTPKGIKIQSFFGHLPISQKRLVAQNISKAFEAHQEEEKEKLELRKKKKQEISKLKKRAKELGLIVSEP